MTDHPRKPGRTETQIVGGGCTNHPWETELGTSQSALTGQEKNEALARWAGFKYDVDKYMWTRDPAGGYLGIVDGEGVLPDLLHSLDAQAKWLWSKLDWLELRTSPHGCDAHIIKYGPIRKSNSAGETPAEACAEAILALIEAEKAVV